MDDDWASDTDEGFGDFAVPEVNLPTPPPKPVAPAPPVNVWAAPASGDARLATRLRHQAAQRPSPRSLTQDPRRLNASSPGRQLGPAPGFAPPRQQPLTYASPGSAESIATLYVTHLPFNTHEGDIAAFFAKCGVTDADVRITRHSDTGNIKAAFVTVRGDINRDEALAMDGVKLGGRGGGRGVYVKIDGATGPAPGFPAPRQQPASPIAAAAGGPTATLYVTHLPFGTHEGEIAAFFGNCGVTPADVRITRHSDTGNVKAAFVTTRGDINRDAALAMDGAKLSGRSVHVKIDGAGRGGGGQRERSGYGFGSRDRRGDELLSAGGAGGHRETGWSSGGWVDRSGPGGFDGGARGDKVREGWTGAGGRGGAGSGKGPAEQREDPTIPTGPPPAGRKKLVLKPRTKPPPVLEVDTRAIDGVKPSAPVVASQPKDGVDKRSVANKFATRQHSGPKKTPVSAQSETWTSAKDGATAQPKGEEWSTPRDGAPRVQAEKWSNTKDGPAARMSGQTQSANKKEDETKKRPILLNTFAALEVNDSDV